MKAKATDHKIPPVKDFKYPCLLANLTYGYVVLATGETVKGATPTVMGTVVGHIRDNYGDVGTSWSLGHFSETWSLESLVEYNGKVELENL